jgi:hypothetical protein
MKYLCKQRLRCLHVKVVTVNWRVGIFWDLVVAGANGPNVGIDLRLPLGSSIGKGNMLCAMYVRILAAPGPRLFADSWLATACG